jgi:hypothetical protein
VQLKNLKLKKRDFNFNLEFAAFLYMIFWKSLNITATPTKKHQKIIRKFPSKNLIENLVLITGKKFEMKIAIIICSKLKNEKKYQKFSQ